jgi:RNA polymerase sigma-70 factor, ECF subfamily
MIDETELGELLRRIGRGEEGAFETLYRMTFPRVYRSICRRIRDEATAEDIAQEVFRQVWQQAGQYRPERSSPWGWLLMISRSRTIDEQRRRQRRHCESALEVGEYASPAERLDEAYERKCEAARVGRMLAVLLPTQQRALGMAFFEEQTHQEIAARTGTPLGTVKSRIRGAIRQMRTYLEESAA